MENKTPQEVLKLLLENWTNNGGGICSRIASLYITSEECDATIKFLYKHFSDATLKFNASHGFYWWKLNNQKDRLDFVKYLSEIEA